MVVVDASVWVAAFLANDARQLANDRNRAYIHIIL